MIFRKYFLVLLIVCVFCLYPLVVSAHTPRPSNWVNVNTDLGNAVIILNRKITLYDYLKGEMETLISEWSKNEDYDRNSGAVSMTATANQPIFGADLYVRSPGDSSKYGTKIRWTSGNSNRRTYSLPARYAFPSTAASGTYKFTLRVYPCNNSGSGDPWGSPHDVSKNVTVQ